MNAFPRVTLPGVNVSPEDRALLAELSEQHEAWRALKLSMAHALIRNGQRPYARPPVAARRKTGKAQRLARKTHR